MLCREELEQKIANFDDNISRLVHELGRVSTYEDRRLVWNLITSAQDRQQRLERQLHGDRDLEPDVVAPLKNGRVQSDGQRKSVFRKVSGSSTDHGRGIYDTLSLRGRIKAATERAGSPVIGDNLIEEATSIYGLHPRPSERSLVSLYTPALMEVVGEVHPDLRLVNSEYFPWLRDTSGVEITNKKPDLFSAHHPLIQYSPPYKDAPGCAIKRLFAFGEQCKHLQIAGGDCFDHNGVAVSLKGVLFDKDEFWMIQSSGNTIVEVVTCQWSQCGSKDILIEFLRNRDPWLEATNALCQELGVTIPDHSNSEGDRCAWLGTGANGRVFRLIGGQVIKVVLGPKSDKVQGEYLAMLSPFVDPQWEAIRPFVFPVVEGSFRSGDINGVRYAGYLLAQEGQQISLPVSTELKMDLAVALHGLHCHGVIHGDPRIENVLISDGNVKWIDFRVTDPVTSTVDRKRDVEILFESIGSGAVTDDHLQIESYARSPSVEKLFCVLVGGESNILQL